MSYYANVYVYMYIKRNSIECLDWDEDSRQGILIKAHSRLRSPLR